MSAWAILAQRERVLTLPLLRRKPDTIAKLFDAFVALRASPPHYLGLSALSLASWCVATGMLLAALHAFGADVSPWRALALWPLSIFVGMLPLTVAGMGTRDAAFIGLLTWTSSAVIDEAPVLAATLAYALVGTWFPAVLGVPFTLLTVGRWARDEPDETGDQDGQQE